MSCCDGSSVIFQNALSNAPAVVTIQSIDLQNGYLKTGYPLDSPDLTVGTEIPLNSTVTWYAWSADGTKGRAQATVTVNVLYGNENETLEFEYYFEPKDWNGDCPCTVQSYSTDSESASFVLTGTDPVNGGTNASITFLLGGNGNGPPAPTFEEWTASAPQAGLWQVGAQVRYGLYFQQGEGVLYLSPIWGPWLTIEDGAFPTIGNLW